MVWRAVSLLLFAVARGALFDGTPQPELPAVGFEDQVEVYEVKTSVSVADTVLSPLRVEVEYYGLVFRPVREVSWESALEGVGIALYYAPANVTALTGLPAASEGGAAVRWADSRGSVVTGNFRVEDWESSTFLAAVPGQSMSRLDDRLATYAEDHPWYNAFSTADSEHTSSTSADFVAWALRQLAAEAELAPLLPPRRRRMVLSASGAFDAAPEDAVARFGTQLRDCVRAKVCGGSAECTTERFSLAQLFSSRDAPLAACLGAVSREPASLVNGSSVDRDRVFFQFEGKPLSLSDVQAPYGTYAAYAALVPKPHPKNKEKHQGDWVDWTLMILLVGGMLLGARLLVAKTGATKACYVARRDVSVRLTGDLYQRLAHPSNELQLGALGSAPPSSAQATDESTTGIV